MKHAVAFLFLLFCSSVMKVKIGRVEFKAMAEVIMMVMLKSAVALVVMMVRGKSKWRWLVFVLCTMLKANKKKGTGMTVAMVMLFNRG